MKNTALLTGSCILLAELLVAVLLWLLGFRITYAPTMENSWDAISACAGWASVVVAGLAIYYAIQVPKKIAEDQNKIALFEKRYAVYEVLNNCVTYAHMLERFNESGAEWNIWFSISFGDHTFSGRELTWDEQRYLFNTASNLLMQSELLFGKESAEQVDALKTKLLTLIQAERHHDNLIKRQTEYIEHAFFFEKEYLPKIKDLLSLK